MAGEKRLDDEALRRLRSKVAGFVDPDVRTRDDLDRAAFDEEFSYAPDERTVTLRSRLRARFEQDSALHRIRLVCAGEPVAVAVRARVLHDPGTAGALDGDLGAGERAGLPGRSTQYVLVKYACRRSGCAETAHGSYYDERFLPECPTVGHGAMRYAEAVR